MVDLISTKGVIPSLDVTFSLVYRRAGLGDDAWLKLNGFFEWVSTSLVFK